MAAATEDWSAASDCLDFCIVVTISKSLAPRGCGGYNLIFEIWCPQGHHCDWRLTSMKYRSINSESAPPVVGGYSQAFEVTGSTRRLYISGQIPVAKDGTVPTTFADQAGLVWGNVFAQLAAADMTVENLVKVNIFLSDRKYGMENREIRQRMLGTHAPALTVFITGIFDDAWLLEIEAIAEA
jgi:2-iminobutanoate/2-iminopropanoate deaminase